MNLDRAMYYIRRALAHLPYVSDRTLRMFSDCCERIAALIQVDLIRARANLAAGV